MAPPPPPTVFDKHHPNKLYKTNFTKTGFILFSMDCLTLVIVIEIHTLLLVFIKILGYSIVS